PEVQVHGRARLGRVGPQLGALEADAVDRLRLLARAVRAGVGKDVAPSDAMDDASLATRVARPARVAAWLGVAGGGRGRRRGSGAAAPARGRSVGWREG